MGKRIWLAMVFAFFILCVVLSLDEILDLPHLLFGAPQTPVNWVEAIIEIAMVAAIGFFSIMWLIHSITERKRAEEALREKTDYLENLINLANAPIIVWDPGFMITRFNHAFERLAGRSADEVMGQTLDILFPEDSREESMNLIRKALAGERWEAVEIPLLHVDGSVRTVLWNSANIYAADGQTITATIAQGQDITERKQAEEELRRYRDHLEELVEVRTSELEEKTAELEQANVKLQEADRLKSIFLASMSHELRTPLNSIIGFTGIILMGMVGEVTKEQSRQLTIVKKNANHLLELINDLLDISKIEAGRVELSLEEFEIADIVGEVIEAFSPAANEKGLELLTNVPEGIMLYSDERRIKQVIMNLVSNAVKFTEQGSVKIAARVLEGEKLELSVIDSGIGIKEEDFVKLFAPFQQIEDSLAKRYEGTGLGLYLTKKLVDLLGGEIRAKSEYGRGSEFTFVLALK